MKAKIQPRINTQTKKMLIILEIHIVVLIVVTTIVLLYKFYES